VVFRNGAKTAVLLAALGGVMVGVGSLFGRGGAIIGLILGLAVVGFSYWKSDTLAIRAARAVPADEVRMPEYYAIMRELTSNAQMPMPRLNIAPAQASHFIVNPSTGRNVVFANLFRTHPTTQERVARLRGSDV
jgi:heat shock protein HtpX